MDFWTPIEVGSSICWFEIFFPLLYYFIWETASQINYPWRTCAWKTWQRFLFFPVLHRHVKVFYLLYWGQKHKISSFEICLLCGMFVDLHHLNMYWCCSCGLLYAFCTNLIILSSPIVRSLISRLIATLEFQVLAYQQWVSWDNPGCSISLLGAAVV